MSSNTGREEYFRQYREKNRILLRAKSKDYHERTKEKQKQYAKEWYAKNKERISVKKKAYDKICGKEYYQKNKERIKLRSREWHAKNHERFIERKRKYNAQHAEERNQKAKIYYWGNINKRREYDRVYYQQHVEEIKQAVTAYSNSKIAELEAIASKVFDIHCFLCGDVDPSVRVGACFHEKHGNKHEYHRIAELRYVLAHPDDFIPLCRGDHQMTHMLMRKHHYVWEEIVNLVRAKKVIPVGPY